MDAHYYSHSTVLLSHFNGEWTASAHWAIGELLNGEQIMSTHWTEFGGRLLTVSECKAKWTHGNLYINGEPKCTQSDRTLCACLTHGKMGKQNVSGTV